MAPPSQSEAELPLKDYGEPIKFDPTFKGPLQKRSCTDVLCLILFVAFLAGWSVVAWYALSKGDLDRLLLPTDSQGRKCGVDSGQLNKPYLVFFDLSKCVDITVPITGCKTRQVCVEKCPETPFLFSTESNTPIADLRQKLICDDSIKKDDILNYEDAKILVDSSLCAPWYLKSESFLKRCISDLPLIEEVCKFIPKSYLRYSRKIREIDKNVLDTENNTNTMLSSKKTPYSNHDIFIYDDYDDNGDYNIFPKSSALMAIDSSSSQQLQLQQQRKPVVEPTQNCENNRQLGSEIVKEKMRRTNTYLARFVGNFFAHFTNATDTLQMGQLIVEDIIDSWWQILIGLLAAMFICLIFIAIMRWIAGVVIWFSIFGVIAMLSFAIYYSTMRYIDLRDNPPEVINTQYSLESVVKSWLAMKDTWLYILIACSIVLLIILLIIIFLRNRIIIAIALVKEGSKAVSSTTSTVFFPLFPWVLQVFIIIFAVAIGLYLASVGDPAYKIVGMNETTCVCTGPSTGIYKNGDSCDPGKFNDYCRAPTKTIFFFQSTRNAPCTEASCNFQEIKGPNIIGYLHAINVFGFFWTIFFISAFGEMVLAATFATWYWTFHKSDVPFFTLTGAFGRTIIYHLGTIAFGSLIIAICRIIRVILEYIDHKLKKYDNGFTKAILCCMKCFFWCLESFLKFLNKNAYIMCAIHGKNFCASAKDAFNLLMRNFLRVATLDKVTDFLFFLSKVMITVGMGALTYVFFTSQYTPQQLHYNLVPVLLVGLGTYLIASVFFGVYSMAVDTLFMCFLEDCERNDGSAEKPYFMSKQLMKILGKKNKIPRHEYR